MDSFKDAGQREQGLWSGSRSNKNKRVWGMSTLFLGIMQHPRKYASWHTMLLRERGIGERQNRANMDSCDEKRDAERDRRATELPEPNMKRLRHHRKLLRL